MVFMIEVQFVRRVKWKLRSSKFKVSVGSGISEEYKEAGIGIKERVRREQRIN